MSLTREQKLAILADWDRAIVSSAELDPKKNPDGTEESLEAVAVGRYSSARRLGITPMALNDAMQEDAEFAKALDTMDAYSQSIAEERLHGQMLSGAPNKSLVLTLERLKPEKWASQKALGSDSNSITVNVLNMAPEEAKAHRQRLLTALSADAKEREDDARVLKIIEDLTE